MPNKLLLTSLVLEHASENWQSQPINIDWMPSTVTPQQLSMNMATAISHIQGMRHAGPARITGVKLLLMEGCNELAWVGLDDLYL